MSSWLRRNRWGLIALPVTVVFAVGANAQRLHDYWWDSGLRHAAATGGHDEWVTWSDSFTDATGPAARTFRVKVTGTESIAEAGPSPDKTDLELPPNLTGWRVTMDFEAAADQVLFGCRMALLDDKGNRYFYRAIVKSSESGHLALRAGGPTRAGAVDYGGRTANRLARRGATTPVDHPADSGDSAQRNDHTGAAVVGGAGLSCGDTELTPPSIRSTPAASTTASTVSISAFSIAPSIGAHAT